MTNRMLRAACFAVAVAVTGVVFAGCDVHPTGPGNLASIAVIPNVTLAIRTSQQFVAVGKDAAGAVVDISPRWSMAAGGGTISDAGLFTADTAPGTSTSTVMASSGGVSGTASVTVINGNVASALKN